MGNFCDCFKSEEGPTAKTPLLTAAQPPAVTSQPLKDGAAEPAAPPRGQSARQHRPEAKENDFSKIGLLDHKL
ncbi:hypothetical protein ElyMa_003222000 [Elysia marginata]|uniref:Uncharacterized protein n=1 Tax=Elysia marginata TaxID=1093978 RepID=A0AAV4J394_9GAST|nr:hypothetical protein ElyMa_003222000 [Elysia marginata]